MRHLRILPILLATLIAVPAHATQDIALSSEAAACEFVPATLDVGADEAEFDGLHVPPSVSATRGAETHAAVPQWCFRETDRIYDEDGTLVYIVGYWYRCNTA